MTACRIPSAPPRRLLVSGYSCCNRLTAQIVKVGEGVRHRVEDFFTYKVGCADVRGEMQRVFYEGLKAMEEVAGSPSHMIEVFDRNRRVRLRLAVQR